MRHSKQRRTQPSVIPRRLGKTGIIICAHCDKTCEHEVFTSTHRFLGEREDVVLDFCSPECKTTYFWDDIICAEVERRMKEAEERVARIKARVEKEIRWFHAHGLCPRCKDRVLKAIHHCE